MGPTHPGPTHTAVLTMTGYPLHDLAHKLNIELHLDGVHGQPSDPAGLAALAHRLGIGHRWARRLLANGLTDRQADHLAHRAGLHPANVWPTWFDGATDPTGPCTCPPRHRRPLGHICDRCGHTLPRTPRPT